MLRKIIKETRPATLVVSILSTFLGIIIAYRQDYILKNSLYDMFRIFLIIIAALLLQSGVNMINNYFEEEVSEEIKQLRKYRFLGYTRSKEEIIFFQVGISFFAITALIGIYLVFSSGWQLLIIEIIGLFAAYAYSGEPFNYKKYGLGALMSFIMMGPLMAYASYYIFSKSFSLQPVIYSFSIGLFIPAILLANELRDYEEDKSKSVGTLTVRIGYKYGKVLYYSLIAFAYIDTLILAAAKYIPIASIVVLTTIPLLKQNIRCMDNNKRKLIPLTARVYLLFSIELFIVLLITK